MTAQACIATRDGQTGLGDICLESGEILRDAKVAWRVYGDLPPNEDNVVLMLPGTSSTRHFADRFVGKGRAVDPGRWCAISMDPLGGGASSRPSDGLWNAFPAYTIADMTNLQRLALRQSFGINRVSAVCGPSMGAFQALDWAARHGDGVDRLVLIVPAARAPAQFRSVVDALEAVLRMGTEASGKPGPLAVHTLEAAAKVMIPWFTAEAHLVEIGCRGRARLVEFSVQRWIADWDPLSLARRYRASAGFEGHRMEKDDRPVLIIPSASDTLLPMVEAETLMNRFPRAVWQPMPGKLGHAVTVTEPGSFHDLWLQRMIADFLAGESSGESGWDR